MPDTRRSQSALATLYADNTAGDISAQDARDELISSHPEKTCQSDTQANEPSSGQLTGDLFFPNNGIQIERYSGSAWQPWGPLFPLTKPVDGSFAWVNQGGASVSTTNGGIYLDVPTDASADQLRIRKKTAPGTPYTITAFLLPNCVGATYQKAGLVFRQSSDGKLVFFGVDYSSTATSMVSYKYSSVTAYSATYYSATTVGGFGRMGLWLRIADNGTSRICSHSADGVNWIDLHTVGRTDYLTADEVGFTANATSLIKAGVTLASWKEA